MSDADLGPDVDEPPEPEVSDPRVADAVSRLRGLSQLAPEEHVATYEEVHRALQEALAAATPDPAVSGDAAGGDAGTARP